MPDLDPPYELLDMPEGQPVTFRVIRWERGDVKIQPRAAPTLKTITAVRMWVPSEDKPMGAPYWDATAGNLIARLLPMLDMLVATQRHIRVTKHGSPPFARHQVDVLQT